MKQKLIFVSLIAVLSLRAQTTVTATLTVSPEATLALETARLQSASTPYTLASDITSAAASLTLTSATGVPAAGQCVIDSEAINFTYAGSGTLLVLTKRAATITTAAAHTSGAPVRVLQLPTINALAKWAVYQYFRGMLLQSPSASVQAAQTSAAASQAAVEAAIATAVQ